MHSSSCQANDQPRPAIKDAGAESNSELMWGGNKGCCTSKLCQEDQLSGQFTGKHQLLREEEPDLVTGKYIDIRGREKWFWC